MLSPSNLSSNRNRNSTSASYNHRKTIFSPEHNENIRQKNQNLIENAMN